jgi:iron(III) transport system ATP-binding protein
MIKIENLHLSYQTDEGAVHAVRGVNIKITQGQFYTLLGPSGCGKTTTLRSLAGLETPVDGEISIDGELVYSGPKGVNIPAHRRDIGMVIQSYAIWPHMDVFENVAFPLHEVPGRMRKADIRDRVLKALALVQLEGCEDRPAPFLSGGQQQRLALARAGQGAQGSAARRAAVQPGRQAARGNAVRTARSGEVPGHYHRLCNP